MSDSPNVSDRRVTRSRVLLRETVPCPLCSKRVSLHYLKYKHVCRKDGDITDEARQLALEGAMARLRQRVGVVE